MTDIKQILSLMERIDPSYRACKQTLNESILLFEADDRIKTVNRIIEEKFGMILPLDGKVRSDAYYVNGNPNTTWKQYLLFHLRHEFELMTNQDVKYLPIVARIAYSNEVRFDFVDDNAEEINLLKRIVRKMKKDDALFQELKKNQNITLRQLGERYMAEFEEEDSRDTEEANNVARTDEYEVKEVPDFETARYYGERSCSTSKLCFATNRGTWEQWTNHGEYKAYVCLRKGWEDIPEKPTEGNPYDLYGTSMIFAFISPKGDLVRSNCRWNHETVGRYEGGVDTAFTKSSLARTIGIPFNEAFNL